MSTPALPDAPTSTIPSQGNNMAHIPTVRSPLVPADSASVAMMVSNLAPAFTRNGSPALALAPGGISLGSVGNVHTSPLVVFRTPPMEDNGLNSRMARMFSRGGSTSNNSSTHSSPVWSPNGSPSLDDGRSIRVISSGDSVAAKIEQERRRARGSIYAQRSRDNSKAKAIRLRLQNEVMQLQASNAQLDRNLAQIAVPAGVVPVSSPNATPGSSDSISPESDTSTEGQN